MPKVTQGDGGKFSRNPKARLNENRHNKEDVFIEHLLWGGRGESLLTLATAFVNEVSLRTIALSQMRKQSL